eukprot:1272949-Heterocapsa_arctica.AAC.1
MGLRLQIELSSSDVVQNERRCARNIMVIAIYVFLNVLRGRQSEESAASNGDSEDARRPFKNLKQP